MLDNLNGELRSEFLCQAVERPVIKPRPLGTSVMPTIRPAVLVDHHLRVPPVLVGEQLRAEGAIPGARKMEAAR